MKKRAWRAVIVAAIALAGLTAGRAWAASAATVSIKEFKFSPPVITVRAGATVTWTNRDEEPHTITSATGAFASTGLSLDDRYSQTFARAGRYEYFCALHPHMKAVVIVK